MIVTVLKFPSPRGKYLYGAGKRIGLVSCLARLNHPYRSYQKLLAFISKEMRMDCSILLVKCPHTREWIARCIYPGKKIAKGDSLKSLIQQGTEKFRSNCKGCFSVGPIGY